MSLPDVFTKNPFTMAWLTWVAMFFFIEGMAILSDVRRATFSNQLRDWLSNRSDLVISLAWLFMIALTAHFLLDLKRG